jgi:isoleucyl-tRNA synthetase
MNLLTNGLPSYQPGWDCHGLPIEHKALQALEKDHRVLQPLEIRKEAKKTAEHAICVQKEELLQFGLLANWDNVYKTFDRTYEVEQLRVFGEMVKKGETNVLPS